jgi:hypothetical protein
MYSRCPWAWWSVPNWWADLPGLHLNEVVYLGKGLAQVCILSPFPCLVAGEGPHEVMSRWLPFNSQWFVFCMCDIYTEVG